MWASVLVWLLVAVVVMALTGVLPPKVFTDYDAPLNLFLYQEPRTEYSDQHVNLWVPKGWRADGGRIPCRWERKDASGAVNESSWLVIYSHGNNENLLYVTQFLQNVSRELVVDAVAWDYSGYGLNPADKFERSPAGVNLSLRTVWNFMVHEAGYAPDHIILWGYSLGSGPTVHLARALCQENVSPAGVVLFGAYSSILRVVSDVTHPRVAAWFQERWNNKDAVADVSCPLLIMHGQQDGLIRLHHAETLKQANPQAKLVVFPNTGHTTFPPDDAVKEVVDWMEQLSIKMT